MNSGYELPNPELPHSQHMEIAILGAAMLDAQSAQDAVAQLGEADFYFSTHKTIFRRIIGLVHSGRGVDYSMVREELEKHKELPSVGGPGFVASLSEGIPRNFSIGDYIVVVKNKAQLRALYAANQFGQEESVDPSEMAADLAERQIERLRGIVDQSTDLDMMPVGVCLDEQGSPEEMFQAMATLGGIKLGWEELDEATGGLMGGELIIVAARPSMGKTAWMCNAANYTASQGCVTAAFTLEQSKAAITRRMIAARSRVDYRLIRKNEVTGQDRALLLEHRAMLHDLPLYLDDSRGMTVSRIRAKLRRLKRQAGGLSIVFIDQLSKVSGADFYQRGMDTRILIGKQTAALKEMAQELGCPIVVFNQLSREVNKRTDFVPRLSDLKESGNIEEDADIVILLHRPEVYDKSDTELAGKGQMILAKQREGETKTCHGTYQGRIMRWEDPRSETTQTDFSDRFREDW